MLAAKSSSVTTGVYSSRAPASSRMARDCGGAMPSSISISATPAEVAAADLAERPGHVEQVVAGDADLQTAAGGAVEQAVEQRLVAGVDLGLGGVRRRRPAAELGVDVLHRQVGPLDEAHLDRRPAAAVALGAPLDEAVDDVVGVGEVGLQDDAGPQVVVGRLVEHGREGVDGQVEVAVLLHVEVDEHGRVAGRRRRRRRRAGGRRCGRPRGRRPARRGRRRGPRS